MNSTAAYTRITENLRFLKSKESLAVLDQTLDFVTKNNLSFIDGFQYFTEAQVEKKKANLVTHSVHMAGFPKIKTLSDFDFEYQPSISKEQIYDLNSLRFVEKQENGSLIVQDETVSVEAMTEKIRAELEELRGFCEIVCIGHFVSRCEHFRICEILLVFFL